MTTRNAAPVIREGQLMKQGQFLRDWRPKWVVVHPNMLLCFRDRNDSISSNTYPLCGAQIKTAPGNPLVFDIQFSNSETRTFKAVSAEERDSWINTLRAAIAKSVPTAVNFGSDAYAPDIFGYSPGYVVGSTYAVNTAPQVSVYSYPSVMVPQTYVVNPAPSVVIQTAAPAFYF